MRHLNFSSNLTTYVGLIAAGLANADHRTIDSFCLTIALRQIRRAALAQMNLVAGEKIIMSASAGVTPMNSLAVFATLCLVAVDALAAIRVASSQIFAS